MSKIKTFLTDSQPGYVLSMLLKFLFNLSLNVLIKKVLTKKECIIELFWSYNLKGRYSLAKNLKIQRLGLIPLPLKICAKWIGSLILRSKILGLPSTISKLTPL